jgi:ubiquinone biosynthesis protein Coq4
MREYLVKLRSAALIFLTHKIALPVLKHTRKPNDFNWSELELFQLPEGTLGNDLYLFLEKRNLPLLRHYARHDIKHVLLGYDTTDEGEVSLQSFMLGNGRVSFPVLATVIYGLITMPEYWGKMKKAYRRGRAAKTFHGWQWNVLVKEYTVDIRNKVFNNKP